MGGTSPRSDAPAAASLHVAKHIDGCGQRSNRPAVKRGRSAFKTSSSAAAARPAPGLSSPAHGGGFDGRSSKGFSSDGPGRQLGCLARAIGPVEIYFGRAGSSEEKYREDPEKYRIAPASRVLETRGGPCKIWNSPRKPRRWPGADSLAACRFRTGLVIPVDPRLLGMRGEGGVERRTRSEGSSSRHGGAFHGGTFRVA